MIGSLVNTVVISINICIIVLFGIGYKLAHELRIDILVVVFLSTMIIDLYRMFDADSLTKL